MQSEAERLPASFRAAIMAEILYHRTQEGGRLYHPKPDGPASPFLIAVDQHRARYLKKLADLKSTGAPVATLEFVADRIEEIRAETINRIAAEGVIEFAD